MKRIVIILAVVALMGTAIGAVFASAADITVDASSVGSGSEIVNGYQVTNVVWTLVTLDPTRIETVAFDVSGSPSEVHADIGTGFVLCTVSGSTWTCDHDPDPLSAGVTSLAVAAAN